MPQPLCSIIVPIYNAAIDLVPCMVHGVMKSQTRLRDFTFTFHFPALEKDMAPHSSVLAWRIPGMGEPGGLHPWSQGQTWLSEFTFTFHFYALEKEMAAHSSVLAWRIPGMGSHRVGHD